jgi:multisubunit Na+/H+ antiporter MnhF subunit
MKYYSEKIPFSLSPTDFLFMMLFIGIFVFYFLVSKTFNLSFIKLIRGKTFPKNTLSWGKYILPLLSIVTLQFFTGKIIFFSVPFMLLIISEFFYLFLADKKTKQQTIS